MSSGDFFDQPIGFVVFYGFYITAFLVSVLKVRSRLD